MGVSIQTSPAVEYNTVHYDCMCLSDGKANPDCKNCKGTGIAVLQGPNYGLHLSYSNWGRILDAIGRYGDEATMGRWEPEDIPTIRKVVQGHRYADDTDDYVSRRLGPLDDLLREAQRLNTGVSWA